MLLTDLIRDPFEGLNEGEHRPSRAEIEGLQAVVDVFKEIEDDRNHGA
jgi:hypothetical protein